MSTQFYLYLFEDAASQYPFTNVSHPLTWEGVEYHAQQGEHAVGISHSAPTFSADPSQARVVVRLRDSLDVAINYISHPPPYKTDLTIWEVKAVSGQVVTEVAPHWRGQVVRVAWRDNFSAAEITCRTTWDIHSSKETMTESLNPLCRFHIGDGRCPVNIENFKESATVTDLSDDISEPTMTVDSLAQVSDTYYKAGMVRVGNGDMRTIDKCETVGGDRVLTLSRAFPSTSVQQGDSIEVFAGDDLTQETCTVIFGAETESGAAWGGWKLTPNRDYQAYGLGALR